MAIFLEHVNVILGKLRQDTISTISTDQTTVAFRVQTAVQRAIARVWNAKQWTFKQSKDTLTLVASTSEYNLPKVVGEPYLILSTLSPYFVRPISEDKFDTEVPNPISSANPEIAMLFENTGVRTQPTSASIVTIASNSASDTTQKVLVRGVVSGEEDSELLSLSGLTSVNSTKSFSKIYAISKSAATAGLITVTSNSGAVSVLTIGPLEKTVRVKKIRFYPIPSAVGTITIKHFRVPFIPTQDFDDSGIPSRWDYIVEQYAFAMALQPLGQDQINEQTVEFQLADKMLLEDMASEEKQDSSVVLVPNRVFSDGPRTQGFIRSSVDGLSFEEDSY